MIDTHCHIDLYDAPEKLLAECDRDGITVLAMTNLPSHFEMGYKYVQPYKKIRLSLGMHPLYADRHKIEFPIFLKNISRTSYIGEVGLDFSREGYATKEIQINTFKHILQLITGTKKILSIHSRRAEKEVLELLIEYKIQSAIFHWYSGPLNLIDRISEAGYYFSINPAMITSEAGLKIMHRVPKDRILPESDGPFVELNKRQIHPSDVIVVYRALSSKWNLSMEETEYIITANFTKLISNLRK